MQQWLMVRYITARSNGLKYVEFLVRLALTISTFYYLLNMFLLDFVNRLTMSFDAMLANPVSAFQSGATSAQLAVLGALVVWRVSRDFVQVFVIIGQRWNALMDRLGEDEDE